VRGIALLVVVVGAAAAWPGLAPRLLDHAASTGSERPAPARPGPAVEGWNRISVPAGPNGQFLVEAQVNGVPVTFLVDSGASAVVLSPEDARRVGLHAGQLRFTLRFRTANGVVRAAPVTLRELRIGQLSLPRLEAVVNEAPIGVSLLGTSFLGRLRSWQVQGGKLHLDW
jgi:aspartyl protease family protein